MRIDPRHLLSSSKRGVCPEFCVRMGVKASCCFASWTRKPFVHEVHLQGTCYFNGSIKFRDPLEAHIRRFLFSIPSWSSHRYESRTRSKILSLTHGATEVEAMRSRERTCRR